MRKAIGFYLISGFLGSGKTTFLGQALKQHSHKKTGVIINEFGSVGIDGKILEKNGIDMIEINNGSIFCACLKYNFMEALVAFLDQPIDLLFVEASGMADPSGIESLLEQLTPLLEKRPEIQRRYDYKGSLCLIDAQRFMELYETFQPIGSQVQNSSLLLVNKTDMVSESALAAIHAKLAELNPNAVIYDTTFGKLPVDVLESGIAPLETASISTDTCDTRPAVYVLTMEKTYDLNRMKAFASALSQYALRLKGFFRAPDGETVHADCVGSYIRIEKSDVHGIDKDNDHKIIVIGKDSATLEKNIREAWQQCFGSLKLAYKME